MRHYTLAMLPLLAVCGGQVRGWRGREGVIVKGEVELWDIWECAVKLMHDSIYAMCLWWSESNILNTFNALFSQEPCLMTMSYTMVSHDLQLSSMSLIKMKLRFFLSQTLDSGQTRGNLKSKQKQSLILINHVNIQLNKKRNLTVVGSDCDLQLFTDCLKKVTSKGLKKKRKEWNNFRGITEKWERKRRLPTFQAGLGKISRMRWWRDNIAERKGRYTIF